MSWIQIRFATERHCQPALEDALLFAGAVSLTYQDAADQPILEPALHETPLWDQLVVTALFEADVDTVEVLRQCEQLFGRPLPSHRVEILEDRDWVRAWMDDYQPMRFGRRVWVCPSWQAPPEPGAVNILLDPGLAFGTGTHPTTAMCLERLDALPLSGKTVIDYGCGSGVLAIAALLLGAERVLATDIDPQALKASRENAERNGVSDGLELFLPEQMPDCPADVLLANILAGPLVELAEKLTALLEPGGTLVLSGLLVGQQQMVEQAYPQVDFEPALSVQEWACLQGSRVQAS